MLPVALNPDPPSVTVVPTAPDDGEIDLIETLLTGCGAGSVPQLTFWTAARVRGPTNPVEGMPWLVWNFWTAANVSGPK